MYKLKKKLVIYTKKKKAHYVNRISKYINIGFYLEQWTMFHIQKILKYSVFAITKVEGV